MRVTNIVMPYWLLLTVSILMVLLAAVGIWIGAMLCAVFVLVNVDRTFRDMR